MNKTQDHLPIADIAENVLLLKNGDGALVLQVSAVNFGLLSEIEQVAIISSFAQLLNSLSYAIQILIHSRRLDITSYLRLLDNAQKMQTNPLLFQIMGKYRQFIQSTIKENDVLDKQFYIVIPLSSLEIGLGYTNKAERTKKIKTILSPRKDQLLKQLSRVGLKAEQLTTDKLIKLFYEIYNQGSNNLTVNLTQPIIEPIRLGKPQSVAKTQPVAQPNTPPPPTQTPVSDFPQQVRVAKHHPFVVEELL
ncbi:MAG: hypothetical protein Q7R49_06395 [Candidatus Daviesbacteria bacterium]|nr:hypothetical protein [Candidatus Daviesbacteria bacterium]